MSVTRRLAYFSPSKLDQSLFTDYPDLKTSALAGQNLGGTYAYSGSGWTPSPVLTQTVTLKYAPTVPGGSYTLSLGSPGFAGMIVLDQDSEIADMGSAPVFYLNIPEPASMLLLAGALPFLRRRRSASR